MTMRPRKAERRKTQYNAGALTKERRAEVYRRLSLCQSHYIIENELSKEWGVSPRAVYNYVRDVEDEMLAIAKETAPARKERLRIASEDHYRVCMEAGKYSAAATSLDRLARIDGLFSDKVELTGANGAPVAISQALEIDVKGWEPEKLALLKAALKATK